MSDIIRLDLAKYHEALGGVQLTKDSGKVIEVNGLLIKGFLPGASVGSVCEIHPVNSTQTYHAEVVGFKDKTVLLMALGEIRGVSYGAKIVLIKQMASVRLGEDLLGRVIDGLGNTIDEKGAVESLREVPLYSEVRNPLSREPIREPLDLGIRAINGLLTVGRGQRVGIMAGSGVGKSVLMGMMARYTNSDVNVIALIGERGREVREFIEHDLGPEGLKKSIVIVVTGDQSALLRMRGAYVAMAVSEYFANQGKHVLLMMDSITRFAMAQREIGLSVGEPPALRRAILQVCSTLKLLERAGTFASGGTVTGLYTVLVEGDDMDDPIGDAVRSVVDGHIVLARKLAQRGHYPAIDVLQSASRVMKNVITPEQEKLALKMREQIAIYREAEDLINIGAYKPGTNPKIDRAIKLNDGVTEYLRQRVEEPSNFIQSLRQMQGLLVNS